MYASTPVYGYGPGNIQNQNQQSAQSHTQHQTPPGSNPNGAPLQPNHNHIQHNQNPPLNLNDPHQQQQPHGQSQPLMYNPQQFAGAHPLPYGTSGPSPSPGPAGMGPNAGGMAMMQNNGMAQMAGPHVVASYQTPYSGSPYGGNMPASASHIPTNFMPTSNAPQFMNATNMNMNPQQMQHMQNMQRMQPPQPSSIPQPGPRASPFAGAHNNTPPNNGMGQSPFPTPQNLGQAQVQIPNSNQQIQPGTIITPQTPNFPQGPQSAGGIGNMAAPMSPGTEAKERERVTLLLEINRELLLEVMRIQGIQAESKKEGSSPVAASPEGGTDKEKAERAEKAKPAHSREYVECMRRLQANLAYLAAIADSSHKPSSQIPAHPAVMTAPPLIAKPPQPSSSANSPSTDTKKEENEEKKSEEADGERKQTLKQQYKRLQELFPGVDPKKDPSIPTSNPTSRAQQQAQMQKQQTQNQGQGQGQIQGSGQSMDPNAQQKLQNDMLRQRMMAQAQAQAQGLSQGQSQQQTQMAHAIMQSQQQQNQTQSRQ